MRVNNEQSKQNRAARALTFWGVAINKMISDATVEKDRLGGGVEMTGWEGCVAWVGAPSGDAWTTGRVASPREEPSFMNGQKVPELDAEM